MRPAPFGVNIEGLCRVLTKYIGTEVSEGPKRGARAVKEHQPLPAEDTQFKATLVINNLDSRGKPFVKRDLVNNKLAETYWTVNNAICGLKLESFKGTDKHPWDVLSRLRAIMATPEFLQNLRNEGYALLDTGRVVKINSQAAEVCHFEFTVSFAEVIAGNSELSWIETASGEGSVSGGGTPHTVPFDTDG